MKTMMIGTIGTLLFSALAIDICWGWAYWFCLWTAVAFWVVNIIGYAIAKQSFSTERDQWLRTESSARIRSRSRVR